MRWLFALLLLAAALWRGWIDWQATIGAGYPFRMTSIGSALETAGPDRFAALVAAGEASTVPWIWDPLATTLLALPLSLLLFVAAGILWLTRRRRRSLF
jgi:hypothetical protein